MPKPLFDAGNGGNVGTVKTSLANTDRFALGTPGYAGADNITFENLHNQVSGRHKLEFTNADLVAFVLTVNHLLGSQNLSVDYYDETYTKQSLDGLLQLTDANNFTINFNGSLEPGTHTLYYKSNPDL